MLINEFKDLKHDLMVEMNQSMQFHFWNFIFDHASDLCVYITNYLHFFTMFLSFNTLKL